MPNHAKKCAFLNDTRAHCTCKAKFNGKPFAHWQREAERLVVSQLLSASMLEETSIIGLLARRRILDLAIAEHPELVTELLQERAAYQSGVASALSSMLGR